MPIYVYPGLDLMASLHLDGHFAYGHRIVLEHFAYAGGDIKSTIIALSYWDAGQNAS